MLNPDVTVHRVSSRDELKAFLGLPDRIYADDPLWVPPLRLLEKQEYIRGTNPVLARSPHALFLATDSHSHSTGRVITYADRRYNEYHGTDTGFFGAFEAMDGGTARALLAAAEDWFRDQKLTGILGPIDPVAECWGVVVEGFDVPPIYLSPHSRPEYGYWIESAGFTKAKDLLVFEADTAKGYRLPDRFARFEEKIAIRHPGISARCLNLHNFRDDARNILHILNCGVEGNWGFTPVGEDEMDDVAAKLRFIVDPEGIWFVEDQGRPVGCALGFPDINRIISAIDGKFWPTGWLHLIRGRKKLRDYRLWGLAVLPEYQGRGLDVLMYTKLYQALKPRNIRIEANYVLEDNPKIVNALIKLGMEKIKSYRVFEKAITD